MHCGTPVRHPQVLDGLHTLPDPHARARQHRDELARAGVQLEARDADHGRCAADGGDCRVGGAALRLQPQQGALAVSKSTAKPAPRLRYVSPLLVQTAESGTLRVKPHVGVLRKRVFTQSGPKADGRPAGLVVRFDVFLA